jgi:hypothetical protein
MYCHDIWLFVFPDLWPVAAKQVFGEEHCIHGMGVLTSLHKLADKSFYLRVVCFNFENHS